MNLALTAAEVGVAFLAPAPALSFFVQPRTNFGLAVALYTPRKVIKTLAVDGVTRQICC